MNFYEDTEKFIVSDHMQIKNTLDKFGVAIVPNLLTKAEYRKSYKDMWNFFEHISYNWETPLKKSNPNTYRQFWNLFPLHSMLVQHWNCGHSQYVWDLRQNPKLVNIFATHIFNKEMHQMLVSFDGISFHLPPEITNRGWYRGNNWHHTDQSFTRPDFECVQGFVSLKNINKGDATLSVFEGSHKFHKQFAHTFNITDKSDWFKLNNSEHYDFYKDKGCVEKRIVCTAGSLVLWDSRTIHCGVEPLKNRPKKNTRFIVYLCYMPRNLSTQKLILKKRKAFEDLRMTTHWPCKSKLFPKNPRTYGKDLPDINPIEKPILTDLGKKLAGY